MLIIESFDIEIDNSSKSDGFGSFSYYYKIDFGLGVKVIEVGKNNRLIKAKTVKSLKKNKAWRHAQNEFKILKVLQFSNLSPLPVKLIPIFNTETKFWYPAIVMEHIEGKAFKDTKRKSFNLGNRSKLNLKNDSWSLEKKVETVISAVESALKSFGVKHNDLHFSNLIDQNGQLKIIDFGFSTFKKLK